MSAFTLYWYILELTVCVLNDFNHSVKLSRAELEKLIVKLVVLRTLAG